MDYTELTEEQYYFLKEKLLPYTKYLVAIYWSSKEKRTLHELAVRRIERTIKHNFYGDKDKKTINEYRKKYIQEKADNT